MLRKLLFLVSVIIFSLTGCGQVQITSLEKLSIPGSGGYFHPRLDDKGTQILLTAENYKGLSLFNLKTGELKCITNADGAGYSPQLSMNGETVLFTSNEFIQNRLHTRLMAYYVPTGISDQEAPPARELSTLYRSGDQVLYKADGVIKSARIGPVVPGSVETIATGIEDQKLMLYINGQTKSLDPMECDSYIWPSVSPDGKRIMAYAMEKGAFICDPEGKLIKELGNLEAPVWAGKDFIAGMVTKDDGHQIISSEIVLMNVKTGKRQTISPAGTIATYPSAATKAEKITFQSSIGEIYLLSYRITF